MQTLKAVLWDVDGTLAETERDGHRIAFNRAFAACGLPWRWDERHYGELLRVTGGLERLMHDMETRADGPATPRAREALARKVHSRKNALYVDIVRDGLIPLREGVTNMMEQCSARSVRMAIATTTSRSNVAALLGFHLGPQWSSGFSALVCGEDVKQKKPDPSVYVRALGLLGISPGEAVAIEDSPGGVAAAHAAGIKVIVTRSAYFMHAILEDALAVGPGLHTCRNWQPDASHGMNESEMVGLDEIELWRAAIGTT